MSTEHWKARAESAEAEVERLIGHLRAALPVTGDTEDALPLHRTEAGYPNCSTCDGGGCPDCTDPA